MEIQVTIMEIQTAIMQLVTVIIRSTRKVTIILDIVTEMMEDHAPSTSSTYMVLSILDGPSLERAVKHAVEGFSTDNVEIQAPKLEAGNVWVVTPENATKTHVSNFANSKFIL